MFARRDFVLGVLFGLTGCWRLRIEKNLRRVVDELVAIRSAQRQYFAQFGQYAPNLRSLAGPEPGGDRGEDAAELIPRTFLQTPRHGYVVSMEASDQGFALVAVPERYPDSGTLSLYLDQTHVIRYRDAGERATAESDVFDYEYFKEGH